MNLIVIGFKACGKTAVGKALARKLGAPFFDIDDVVERIYRDEAGCGLRFREIYRKHGKDFFRELEHRAVQELAKKKDSVIAVGGGTVMFFDNADLLKKCGKFIYLDEDPAAMLCRIVEKGVPAFLDPNDLEGSMQRELEKRKPHYEKLADYSIDIRGLSIARIADKLFETLKKEKAFENRRPVATQ
ncbi:MAG: shikimate kinase [Candidatus Diapherotrites archaeon]|nr:shikimate kinase [Candidatus Diapherotrites archaeon]